ncbi:MAG: adenylate/guanylate cyclase domain-containing protein [Leptospiraceae bacterium]|nr:adenylate/guanylate cyclase domain-containing protein [Leptospiraceae bacterium]
MSTLPRDEYKARSMSLVAISTTIIISLITGILAFIQAHRPLEFAGGVVNVAGAVVYMLTLWGQWKGRSLAPRLFFLVTANIHLGLIVFWYGWSYGAYLFYPVMMALPFVIFTRRQKRLILPMAALALLMLVLMFSLFQFAGTTPIVIRPPAESELRSTIGTSVNLLLMSLAMILLMRYMRNVQFQAEDGLEFERRRSDELLLNVLPAPIAERLKKGEQPIADHFDAVTILFADIVGFTELAAKKSAGELVELLNEIFSGFDELADQYELEKIKTIGDCFMAVAGLPRLRDDHALAAVRMASAMRDLMEVIRSRKGIELQIRIGVHSGPVVAGVIGRRKFSYDLWGDAVNVASRMESSGESGRINLSEDTYRLVNVHCECEHRGKIYAKGKGELDMYFLNRIKTEVL